MSTSLQKLMQELQSTEGLQYAILFNDEGEALSEVEGGTPEQSRHIRHAMAIGMGALNSMGESIKKSGEELLEQSQVSRVLVEFPDARLLMLSLKEIAVLGVLADHSYNLGLLITLASRWEQQLVDALK